MTPPLPTMPSTPTAAMTTTNTNDAYTKMPPTPTHGNMDHDNLYDQNHKQEHRSFWHSFMSLMTCGTH